MEILVNTLSIALIIGFLIIPYLILKLLSKQNDKYRFVKYITIGLVLSAIFSLILSWWNHMADEILLRHYDAFISFENTSIFKISYENVSPENLQEVKNIERRYMGIGWPLKAIFAFVFYSPYLFFAYIFNRGFRKLIYKK